MCSNRLLFNSSARTVKIGLSIVCEPFEGETEKNVSANEFAASTIVCLLFLFSFFVVVHYIVHLFTRSLAD